MKKSLIMLILSSSLFADYINLPEFTTFEGMKVVKQDLYNQDFSIFKKYKKTEFTTYNIYGGILHYTNSQKNNGIFGGLYYSYYSYPSKIELNINLTTISYNTSSDDLKQEDITLIDHYYKSNFDIKLGGHLIHSTDSLSNWGKIGIFGIQYYKLYNYNIGADVYYSHYDNVSTSPRLLQYKGYVGKSLGKFYISAAYNYIHILKNYNENGFNKNYHFSNALISYKINDYTTTITGWKGKRVFGIDNGGFVINNLNEEQLYGGNIKETIKLDDNSNIQLGYGFIKFVDNNKNAYQNSFLLNYELNY